MALPVKAMWTASFGLRELLPLFLVGRCLVQAAEVNKTTGRQTREEDVWAPCLFRVDLTAAPTKREDQAVQNREELFLFWSG
ncbi:hypothetical protein VTI74DRAFT_11483 [Chaetomium olivicolor]